MSAPPPGVRAAPGPLRALAAAAAVTGLAVGSAALASTRGFHAAPRPLRALAAAAAVAGLTVGSAALAPPPARLSEADSPVVAWRDGTAAWTRLAPDDRWRMRASLDRVDPDLVRALRAVEDGRAGWHPGVDPIAVLRAAWSNARAGHVVSGASTLDMQVIRMVEPRPRTIRSKLVEAWRALGLRARLGADGVLEAWLTFAPYGGNVEGVETAAWMIFGHDARSLSADEICLLLAVPQDPTPRAPRPDHAEALRAARDRVAIRLDAAGLLPDGTQLDDVLRAPVPTALRPPPFGAPHAAAALSAAQPGRVASALDAPTQTALERIVRRHQRALADQGIHNGAALVVEHADMSVRAALGGFDWWDPAHAGNIDALHAARSTGSTLKPWLYAIGLDRGLMLPETLAPDVPTRYGGWLVKNYDETWSGAVRMETALSRSLNVPFVDLLAHVGVDPFVGDLARCGAAAIRAEPGYYGLSAAVGGVELAPVDLAVLYAALATDGACRPLRWTVDAPVSAPLPAISDGAAWLTRRALRLRDRPDTPTRRDIGALPRDIAWKTGTSQGHHDAWAIGMDGRYLVVIWLGNLDRRPSHALVGADAAAPILFDVLEALGPNPADDPRPASLSPLAVCALSGHRPGEACPATVTALALPEVPGATCPYHARVEIDDQTGRAVLPGCRTGPTHTADVVAWPAAMERFLADRGEDLPRRPALAPGCSDGGASGPRILSPLPGQLSLITPSRPADAQQIPLVADTPSGGVSWFVDGRFLGRAADGRAWWTPAPGDHEVVAVDDLGRANRATLRVASGAPPPGAPP